MSKIPLLLMLVSVIQVELGIAQKRTWNYTLLSITTTSSDEEKLKVEMHLERISREEMAFSGSITINYDITDDNAIMDVKSYRSDTANMDFKILPFNIKEQGMRQFMNEPYKEFLMETFASGCSDLPSFEDKVTLPLEKKTYTLDKCIFTTTNLPDHMQDGYYKVLYTNRGEVDVTIEGVFEIENQY